MAGHLLETLPKGADDIAIWAHAQEHELIVLTRNPDDFVSQAAPAAEHHGLLVVHGENDPRKKMSNADIAAAIEHVCERYGDRLPAGTQINLNEWRRPRTE